MPMLYHQFIIFIVQSMLIDVSNTHHSIHIHIHMLLFCAIKKTMYRNILIKEQAVHFSFELKYQLYSINLSIFTMYANTCYVLFSYKTIKYYDVILVVMYFFLFSDCNVFQQFQYFFMLLSVIKRCFMIMYECGLVLYRHFSILQRFLYYFCCFLFLCYHHQYLYTNANYYYLCLSLELRFLHQLFPYYQHDLHLFIYIYQIVPYSYSYSYSYSYLMYQYFICYANIINLDIDHSQYDLNLHIHVLISVFICNHQLYYYYQYMLNLYYLFYLYFILDCIHSYLLCLYIRYYLYCHYKQNDKYINVEYQQKLSTHIYSQIIIHIHIHMLTIQQLYKLDIIIRINYYSIKIIIIINSYNLVFLIQYTMIQQKSSIGTQANKTKQKLAESLIMLLQKQEDQQILTFLSGYACGLIGITPKAPIIAHLKRILGIIALNVREGVIIFNNFIQVFVQCISFYTKNNEKSQINEEKFIRDFQQKSINLCGELAFSKRYLRQKWMNETKYQSQIQNFYSSEISRNKIEQQQNLKLIKQLQQQDKQQLQKYRKQRDTESEKLIQQMLKQQQQKKKERTQKMNEMQKQNMTCQICLQQIPYIDAGTLSCGHIFHKSCIRGHIQALVNTKKIQIPCPAACGFDLPLQDIQQYIDGELKQKFEKFCFDVYVQKNSKQVSWCPTAGCTAVFTIEGDLDNYRCPACKKHYCLNCRCEYHRGMTCAQYKITHSYGQDDKKFQEFVRGAKFKQCPKCKFWVQRIQGCSTMACRCGHQFCYDCGGSDCPHGMCKNNPGGGGGIIPGIFRRGGRRR